MSHRAGGICQSWDFRVVVPNGTTTDFRSTIQAPLGGSPKTLVRGTATATKPAFQRLFAHMLAVRKVG